MKHYMYMIFSAALMGLLIMGCASAGLAEVKKIDTSKIISASIESEAHHLYKPILESTQSSKGKKADKNAFTGQFRKQTWTQIDNGHFRTMIVGSTTIQIQ